jgi:hypothetical protein
MNKLNYAWVDRRYLIDREKEAFWRRLAWLLPKRLVMWSFYRVLAHATAGKYGSTVVPELPAMDAVRRFIEDNKL